MKEKTKLKLKDIEIQSFITSLDENYCDKIVGASAGEICETEEAGCEWPPTDWHVCTGHIYCPNPTTKCPGSDASQPCC